jgi:glucokinase
MATPSRYLVSDIGGTNIRVAVFDTDPRQRLLEANYSKRPDGTPWIIRDALADYVARTNVPIKAACMGVAGRVREGTVKITNRPDTIVRDEIAGVLGVEPAKLRIVNDMPPHLASVERLKNEEVEEILPGKPQADGARGIVMPGSGLGIGGAMWTPAGYEPFPSEGGHLEFAPRDDEQVALLEYTRAAFAAQNPAARTLPISFENLVSGPGLRRLYAFYAKKNPTDLDALPKGEEITAVATEPSAKDDDPRRLAVNLMVKLMGQAAGNLALLLVATGGVYLGGSIGLTLRDELHSDLFRETFLSTGPKHRALLEEIPVRLLDYKDTGLLGAGVLAMRVG